MQNFATGIASQTKKEELRRIARIAVRQLFGHYDHDIDLNLDERVTIIHGPNGVGKTVLLHLVSDLFSGRYPLLARVPYKKLRGCAR